MNTQTEGYSRVTIQGELTCLSDLHSGSGEFGIRSDNNKEITVNELIYDCAQRPIITAASLRGYLHAQFSENDINRTPLFGSANEADGSGQAGALRLYDCRLCSRDEWHEQRRSRVAIDAVTRTAKDKQLFNDLLVPKGSKFVVEMALDDVSETALNALLKALASLNANNPAAQLGQGKSHGRGNVQWTNTEIKALDHSALQNWLLKSDVALEKAEWTTISDQDVTPPTATWQRLELRYCFDAPVLINDPSIVKDGDNEPDLRFMRRGNDLLIPGSSIKGMFRARARRILMTLGEDNSEKTDELVSAMFGGKEGAGTIRFYDATSPYTKETIHEQTMIAIDRFTGGVKNGAMLVVEAARPKYATGTIAVDDKMKPWQQALWLYCLRDAMEGDLALGWGQARGFGAFHLVIAKPDSSDDFYGWENYFKNLNKYLNKDELNAWTTDLKEKLKKCAV